MAEIYRVIHPQKYYSEYVSLNERPDGRKFEELRGTIVNVANIGTADASSVVKIGSTTVVCGIKMELAMPKAEEPDVGYFVSNIELPALCSSKYRPGPPSDHAQATSTLLSDIIASSKCLNLKELCIVPEKLAWVLYSDIYCLDNDGALIDACITSLMAALKTLKLPHVDYDLETEECVVNPDKRTPLKLDGLPVASSFAVYSSDRIIADPNAYEEELCGGPGANFVVCWNKGSMIGVHKFGGPTLPVAIQENAFKIAERKASEVEKCIEAAIKNKKL